MEHPLITTNPGIESGKPIIKGTRITVEMLADEYAGGRTIEQLLYSYPHLTRIKARCTKREKHKGRTLPLSP